MVIDEEITISANYDDFALVDVALHGGNILFQRRTCISNIVFADYQEYFTATRNERSIQLSLDVNLPDSVLTQNSFIALTIVATIEGNSDLAGYTVVTISLPDTEDNPPVTGKGKVVIFIKQPK